MPPSRQTSLVCRYGEASAAAAIEDGVPPSLQIPPHECVMRANMTVFQNEGDKFRNGFCALGRGCGAYFGVNFGVAVKGTRDGYVRSYTYQIKE